MKGIKGKGEKRSGNNQKRVKKHCMLLSLGNEEGEVKGEVDGRDWVICMEGRPCQDDQWVLYYMKANCATIKNTTKRVLLIPRPM